MMTHARGRASKCTLWPSVSLCLCGSRNPFLLGKDLQISSTEVCPPLPLKALLSGDPAD